MSGGEPALLCLIVGGIVPGDELMAVNGKILIDASLTEGQNSLARAWNSGGVGLPFKDNNRLYLKGCVIYHSEMTV